MTVREHPLLVIALTGADGTVVSHLVDEGGLPHMAALMDEGALAPISWQPPASTPGHLLTIATGVAPYLHGVTATMVPRPDGFGFMPANRRALVRPPLWERWADEGLTTAVIGWPATHGSGGTKAQVVADTFFQIEGRNGSHWPVFPESVHPPELTRDLIDLRVHPADLSQSLGTSRLAEAAGPILAAHGAKGAQMVSRLETMARLGRYFLSAGGDAVFLNINVLELIGLPRREEDAAQILLYYSLVDAALGALVQDIKDRLALAILIRPPSEAFELDPQQVAERGLALFVSSEDLPDSLEDAITPSAISARLCRMIGCEPVIVAAHKKEAWPTNFSLKEVQPDPTLDDQLTRAEIRAASPYKSEREAAVRARRSVTREFLRSAAHENGPAFALEFLKRGPGDPADRQNAVLDAAERLVSDGASEIARDMMAFEPGDDNISVRRLCLRAGIAFSSDHFTDALSDLEAAIALAPRDERVVSLQKALNQALSQQE